MITDEVIFICALRYAVYRHTYIVSIVIDNIRKNIEYLSQKTKCVMCKDIIDMLEQVNKDLVSDLDKVDIDNWYKLLVDLYNRLDEEGKSWVQSSINVSIEQIFDSKDIKE